MASDLDDFEDFELDVWTELKATIIERIGQHGRSQQVEIGPSGLGTPCERKLAHRLANTPTVRPGDVPWRPTVGTAMHTWLAAMLEARNRAERVEDHARGVGRCASWCGDGSEPYGYEDEHGDYVWPGAFEDSRGYWHRLRYMVEFEVLCGTINGREIHGHVDFYDRKLEAVGDWKIAGPKSLKDHHAAGMGPEYKVQANVYGRGVRRLGLGVRRVMVCFLPMNGELHQGYVLSDLFDASVGTEAFKRARRIETYIGETDAPELLSIRFEALNTAPDYCSRCPWFSPGTTDFAAACPGDESMFADLDPGKGFEGLL